MQSFLVQIFSGEFKGVSWVYHGYGCMQSLKLSLICLCIVWNYCFLQKLVQFWYILCVKSLDLCQIVTTPTQNTKKMEKFPHNGGREMRQTQKNPNSYLRIFQKCLNYKLLLYLILKKKNKSPNLPIFNGNMPK